MRHAVLEDELRVAGESIGDQREALIALSFGGTFEELIQDTAADVRRREYVAGYTDLERRFAIKQLVAVGVEDRHLEP